MTRSVCTAMTRPRAGAAEPERVKRTSEPADAELRPWTCTISLTACTTVPSEESLVDRLWFARGGRLKTGGGEREGEEVRDGFTVV